MLSGFGIPALMVVSGLTLAACNAVDTSGTASLGPIDEVTLTGTWYLRHLVQNGMTVSTPNGGKSDTTLIKRDTTFKGTAYSTQYKGDLTFVTMVPGPAPANPFKATGKWSLSGGRLTTLTGVATPYDTAVSEVGINNGDFVSHNHLVKTTVYPTYTFFSDVTTDATSSRQ